MNEPTREMLAAGYSAAKAHGFLITDAEMTAIFHAMLAARTTDRRKGERRAELGYKHSRDRRRISFGSRRIGPQGPNPGRRKA